MGKSYPPSKSSKWLIIGSVCCYFGKHESGSVLGQILCKGYETQLHNSQGWTNEYSKLCLQLTHSSAKLLSLKFRGMAK